MKTTGAKKNEKQTKIEDDKKYAIVSIIKGGVGDYGSGEKIQRIKVIFAFIRKAMPEYKIYESEYMFHVVLECNEKDDSWVFDNVLSRVTLSRVIGESDVEEKAEKLYKIYLEKKTDDVNHITFGFLKKYLDKMYMKYDVWVM